MSKIIIQESERMRVMVALGQAERHITEEQSSERHRRTREAINVCQGIFGPGPKASRNVLDALERVRDALQLLRGRTPGSTPAHDTPASMNLFAAANSLEVVQGLLQSYLDSDPAIAKSGGAPA
jgi:hypothetical protein